MVRGAIAKTKMESNIGKGPLGRFGVESLRYAYAYPTGLVKIPLNFKTFRPHPFAIYPAIPQSEEVLNFVRPVCAILGSRKFIGQFTALKGANGRFIEPK